MIAEGNLGDFVVSVRHAVRKADRPFSGITNSGGDVSNPQIREAVLDSLPEGEAVSIDSIEMLRYECGLLRFTNKQVRRALESLYYGHAQINLIRPRIDEFTRGWHVRKLADS